MFGTMVGTMGANIENNIVVEETLRGIAQLVRPWICSLEVTSSSPTNLRTTEDLHGR
jgi:hypothetical protein